MTTQSHINENTPLNALGLAKAQKVPYGFVLDARKAGFVMPGNRSTAAEFANWRKENPDFRKRARELRKTDPDQGRH